MSFDDDLRRELMQTFVAEAREYVQALNHDLLQLEQNPGPEQRALIIQQLFREAHNLKGAARAVGLGQVGELAHRLETIFGRLKSSELVETPELYDLIYQGVDGIGAWVSAAGHEEGMDRDDSCLLAALDAAGRGEFSPEPSPAAGDSSDVVEAGTPVAAAPAPETQRHSRAAPSAVLIAAEPAASEAGTERSAIARSYPEAGGHEGEETVRLSTARLDELMAHIGELQVSRFAFEQSLADVRLLMDDLAAWDAAWRKSRLCYRQLMNQFQGRGEVATRFGDSPARFVGRAGQNGHHLGAVLHFLSLNERLLADAWTRTEALYRRMKSDSHRMAQVVGALQEDVRRTRLRPLATVLESFPRMVRDLARATGKEVRLVIEGEETEVDRSVVEQLRAPLVHLLRNAVDHGIEMPEERRAAGKDPTGTVHIQAWQQGDTIVIRLRDDGAGIDVGRIAERAVASGVITDEQAASLSDRDALELIFRSGFSTRRSVTEISGRGVGLDVLRDHIEHLQGTVAVTSQPGQGTTFTLTVPLTVATTLALLVEAAGQPFAVPIVTVNRIVHIHGDEVRWIEGGPVIKFGGRPAPVSPLSGVLGLTQEVVAWEGPAIVLGAAERRTALLVDELLGVQELVVKSLPAPLYRVRYVAGASILGNGEAVLVLNGAELLFGAHHRAGFPVRAVPAPKSEPAPPPLILVADDSVTTRTLEKSILETAGYRVRTAADGAEAWEQLQSGAFDLLVSDVDMPHMDGFELTAAVRGHSRCQHLPVILVTSFEAPEDRQRGIEVGADAYIVKGSFDQQHLLATIEQFV